MSTLNYSNAFVLKIPAIPKKDCFGTSEYMEACNPTITLYVTMNTKTPTPSCKTTTTMGLSHQVFGTWD